MANIITSIRIIFSIALLFCQALSDSFYALYIVAGITDMIDGTVARKTNTASEFGSKLDTVADFVFVVICLLKLIPIVDIPVWLYIWTGIIAIIKIINVIYGYVLNKDFASVHTLMNKATGALLFAVPLTLSIVDLKYSSIVVCIVATFAAVQEGHYIRTGKEI